MPDDAAGTSKRLATKSSFFYASETTGSQHTEIVLEFTKATLMLMWDRQGSPFLGSLSIVEFHASKLPPSKGILQLYGQSSIKQITMLGKKIGP